MSWASVKLRHVCESPTPRSQAGLLPYVALEHIESRTGRLLPGIEIHDREADGAALFSPGDVLFGKLRPYLHKVLDPQSSGYCSTELLILRPSRPRITSRYLYYVALSSGFVDWANATSYGTKMPRTSWESLRQYELRLPPTILQAQITGFLDDETARIDDLIAKHRKLIELLAEKRLALISQTVTEP